jgi:outer membrane protein
VNARSLSPALLFLCASLLGCATDQQRDINTYRAISDPPGNLPRFTTGQSLTLVHALALTAAYNEQLALRGEDHIHALAARQRAGAALKPTIDLFGDISLRENTGSGIAQANIGLTGQYRFLTGLSDLRNVDAADARIRSTQWLILDLRESLLLQAARAYYETLLAERLAAVLQTAVLTQEERLRDARARNEVGFTRPLDVGQIEAQVSRTRAQLISAQRQARDARSTLSLLANADASRSGLIDGFAVPDSSPTIDDLLLLVSRHRQDILSARNEANAARSFVDAAIGQYAPSITLNLDYFLARSPDDSAAVIASLIQVRFPLFSAGRIEADIRSSWSVFRQTVLDYRLRLREARADAQIALSQLDASRDRARELKTLVDAARQTVALAEASYEAGLGTNLERVTAQDELLAAELEAVNEEFTTKITYLSLLRACGLLSHRTISTPLPEARPEELIPPDAPLIDRSPEAAG